MTKTRIFSGCFESKHHLGTLKIFLRRDFLSGVVSFFLILSLGLFQYNTPQSEAFAQTISFAGMEKVIQAEFLDKFDQGTEKVKIIVLLRGYKAFKGLFLAEDIVLMNSVRSAIRKRQDKVLSGLDPKQFQLKRCFENILGFSGEATLEAIEDLAQMDEVELIEENKKVYKNTFEGISLMGAEGLHSLNYYGSGVSIAICDTGIDYTHPELGGSTDYLDFPNSKVIGGYDYGDLDNYPMDCEGHGTACAGIAAGNSGGGYTGGVAPSAKIYALKIVSGCVGSAYFDDIADAWDWCVIHKNDDPSNPIMIISTSFGGDYLTSSCDATYPTLATAASNAVANGITIFCSSGNDGYCDGIAAPACITDAVSVGAVYDAAFGNYFPCINGGSCVTKYATTGCSTGYYAIDPTAADLVTSYSNSASFLDILAAANCATTTDIVGSGGYDSGNYDSCFGGTSAACPYAAGAGALLQNYAKSQTGSFLTPAQLKSALVTYGEQITDSKNGLTYPRVNALAATAGVGGPVTTTIGLSTTTTVDTTTTTIPPEEMPSLMPCAPYGWSYPIVPSSQQGTNTYDPETDVLYPNPQKTYIDFALCNENNGATTESFSVTLYIDGVEALTKVLIDEIEGKTSKLWLDEQFNLSEGEHTLKLVVDVNDDIDEADEDDNTFEMSFTWESGQWNELYSERLGVDCQEDVNLLRSFRDEVLRTTKTGKTYVELLYRNSSEIASLLLEDEDLGDCTSRVIEQLLPALASLLNGGEARISSQTIMAIEVLLDNFEVKASPGVKTAIKKVKKGISKGEIFDQLGIKVVGSCR